MSETNGIEKSFAEVSPKRSFAEAKPEVWISAQEAARILGISERAVQLRAQKGTLPSKREGTRWLVTLANTPEAAKPSGEEEAKHSEVFAETSPKRSEEGEVDEALLVPHLLEEIAFLRSELTAQREAAATSESELRRLMLADKRELQELRHQLAIVAAPVESQSASPSATDAPKRAQESDTVNQSQEAPNTVQEPSQGKRRRFWEVWKRKEGS